MNFTKGIKGLVLTAALVGGISFLPTNAGAETLGWSEETGYVNTEENVMYSSVMYASSKPDSHTAKIDHYSPSQMNTRKVTGYTKWSGKNHYTRARFDNGGSKVAADSGRKYGYNSTSAASGWYDTTWTSLVAKTYWGL